MGDPRSRLAWRQMRTRILHRDRHRCHWCGKPANTVDHLVPLADGGPLLDPRNLAAACRRCNSSRGAHLLNHRRQLERGTPTVTTPRQTWRGALG